MHITANTVFYSIHPACITLHNLLTIDHEDEHNQLLTGEWRKGNQMTEGDHAHAINAATYAGFRQRDYRNHYFNSPAGSVDWQ